MTRNYLVYLAGKHLGFDRRLRSLEAGLVRKEAFIETLKFELHGLHDVYMQKFREIERQIHWANQLRDPIIQETQARPDQQIVRFLHIADSPVEYIYDADPISAAERATEVTLANYRFGCEWEVHPRHQYKLTRDIALVTTIARKIADTVYDRIMTKYGYREEIAKGR